MVSPSQLGARRYAFALAFPLILFLVAAPAWGTISVAPSASTVQTSPVHYVATASSTTSLPVNAMAIYVDGTLAYTVGSHSLDTFIPVGVGVHSVTVQAWDTAGNVQVSAQTLTVGYGVSVASPAAGASVTSPVHISAQSQAPLAVTGTAVYVDGVLKASNHTAAMDANVSLPAGSHYVVVQSWDSSGKVYKSSRTINVVTSGTRLRARDQFLQQGFQAGVAHIDGRYGFTTNNFLVEGASSARNLGAHAIFVYLYPGFRASYPDKNAGLWPSTAVTSLAQLAQTAPYQNLFSMNFNLYVLTALTFSNGGDNVLSFNTNPNAAVTEEQEMYDLTLYLLNTYKGTGKTFILKNWETDQLALAGNYGANISSDWISALQKWFTARQRGVERARQDAGNPAGVAVLNAIEVSRVLDYAYYGLARTINTVVPAVRPDMVTYSSYDSTKAGTDSTSLAAVMNQALNTIDSLAPDPQYLRRRRILISEYGLFENSQTTDWTWRANTILSTASGSGLSGAFLWQLYDNECTTSSGSYYPVDSTWGTSPRPGDADCLGLWLVKPDGTDSAVLSIVKSYW
jgi:hypothetical protein